MLIGTWATVTPDAGLQTESGRPAPKLGRGGGLIGGLGLVAEGFFLTGSGGAMTFPNNIITTLGEPEVTTLGDNIVHTGS